jgi:hypothetical protein
MDISFSCWPTRLGRQRRRIGSSNPNDRQSRLSRTSTSTRRAKDICPHPQMQPRRHTIRWDYLNTPNTSNSPQSPRTSLSGHGIPLIHVPGHFAADPFTVWHAVQVTDSGIVVKPVMRYHVSFRHQRAMQETGKAGGMSQLI